MKSAAERAAPTCTITQRDVAGRSNSRPLKYSSAVIKLEKNPPTLTAPPTGRKPCVCQDDETGEVAIV